MIRTICLLIKPGSLLERHFVLITRFAPLPMAEAFFYGGCMIRILSAIDGGGECDR
ncbi:MAG: hypothetical protein MUF49_07985 [Oculatellaceae cyanobacterium Prado106]|jgi:hypothetical protein|nr:hypothetical protein [Oculatellaceae cyanobacterium Prado106]